jgi:hypothetical protein
MPDAGRGVVRRLALSPQRLIDAARFEAGRRSIHISADR